MAALSSYLGSDERVLYRTRRGWRTYIWLPYAILLTYIGAIGANWASGGFLARRLDPFELAVIVTVAPLIATLRIMIIDVIVTDKRVLWRKGVLRRKQGDIAHSEIASSVVWWSSWPSRYIIRRRSGEASVLLFAFDFDRLDAALAEGMGRGTAARASPRLEWASIVLQTVTLWVAAAILGGTFYLLIQFAGLAELSTAMKVAAILVLSLLTMIVAFLSLVAGRLAGFLLLRFLLTAEDIRLYLETVTTWCDRRGKSRGLCKYYLTLMRKVLGWLYGPEILTPPLTAGVRRD